MWATDTKSVFQRANPLASALSIALASGALGFAAQTHAATIVVNTTADSVATDGLCSLREAIGNANANAQTYPDCAAGSGADTIVFDPAVFAPNTLTVSKVSGSLELTDKNTTTIDGQGVVAIDGNHSTEIFVTKNGSSSVLQSLTVRNGYDNFFGGGIYNQGALTIKDGTLSGNVSAFACAAVFNNGVLTVTGSTFSGNYALDYGGAICNLADANQSAVGGIATLSNTTLSGNSAGCCGAAIWNSGYPLAMHPAVVVVGNSTISGNTAPSGSAVYNIGGTVTLTNSIVADAPDSTSCFAFSVTDVISDNGGNIDSGTSCSFNAALGSLSNTDPLLGSLGDNGGSTATKLPKLGSPAVDAVMCSQAPDADQRGVARPQGDRCDIGSVERKAVEDTIFLDRFEGY
jgi:CSLREA domain-containing protein